MKIVKNLREIDESNIGFTIGNYDGVHLGHHHILNLIKDDCIKEKLKLVVMTFIPHPKEILGGKQYFLINSYEDRRALLKQIGVDYLVEIKFHRDFSTMKPDFFLDREILFNNNIKKIYLGHDFAFGKDKCADRVMVREKCSELGIEIELMDKFMLNGEEISSSKIRNLLSSGHVEYVTKILGRNFFLKGNIIKGAMRGRKLGFPTANMDISDKIIIPQKGVYITQTRHENILYKSITNIGHNPTFKDDKLKMTIETHILDFDLDIYGESIQTYFVKWIRKEIKFKSKEDLISQIKEDIKYLNNYLGYV